MNEEVQDRIEKMIKKSEAILNAGKEKLKPCPFCGGEAELIQSGKKFSVRCKEISCENHTALFSHWTIPVYRWNRRYKGDKE